ncbi:MAG: hypothetical protein OEY20_13380 [Gemmatimonadota bacterium]|nr:hypothetical protein [Gemmatimonadota bacterium]MDH5198229.1 hypothetical protein [Gemmatimonadota bacterium]
MRTFRRIRRSIAGLVLVLYLPACHTYVPLQEMTPQEYIATKHPKQVRLTLNDVTHGLHRLELLTPSVGPGDSLTGLPRGADAPVTVALSTIERLEVRESNPSGTTGAVVGGLAVVGVGVLVAYLLVMRGVSCDLYGGC